MAGYTNHIYGETTRELHELFTAQAGEMEVLHMSTLRTLLNEIQLFPSMSQIHEFVCTACESSGRTPVDHVTFGEFCFLVMELRDSYKKNPLLVPQPRSQFSNRSIQALEERRRLRRLSAHFKVFLGGSCNPTTWRADIAIPFLKKHGITFYNPQVSDWQPELMTREDQAKQTAELLFFVIDNQTRSTASMVEAAYLAGCGRQLILIIRKFGENVYIAGEPVSQNEVDDLERSHAYLTDLVERQCIPVFSDIDNALHCTQIAIANNIKVCDLTLQHGAQQVKHPGVRPADKLIKAREAFQACTCSSSGDEKTLSKTDLFLAYRMVTDEDLPASFMTEHADDNEFTYQQFICLVSEFRYKKKSLWRRMMGGIVRWPSRAYDWMRGGGNAAGANQATSDEHDSFRHRDVFLGGSCGESTWREDVAIPHLMKQGISFFNPQRRQWTTRYISYEAMIKDTCKILLYVITGETTAITSMLEVGHYIGMGCNIVLYLQDIPYGSVIDGQELTEYAVKDYNRARTYLADLANRDGIPVIRGDIQTALNCVTDRLKAQS